MEKKLMPILVSSFNSMCRICVQTADINIFTIQYENQKLVDIFEKFTSLKIDESDHLPHNICKGCMEEVLKFYKFRKKCLATHVVLTKVAATEEKRKLNAGRDIKQEHLEVVDISDSSAESGIETSANVESVSQASSNEASTNEQPSSTLATVSTETTCYVCNIHFESHRALVLHRGQPSHPKGATTQVPCTICSKSFMIRNMKQHMSRHTQKRAHKCDVCEQSFNRASNLRQHQLIHLKQKKFVCDVCGKGFRRKQNRNAHMLKHTRKKLYTCKGCEQRFSSLRDLRKHKLSDCAQTKRLADVAAIKEEKFRCSPCEAVFFNQADLSEHVASHKIKMEPEIGQVTVKMEVSDENYLDSDDDSDSKKTKKGAANSKKLPSAKKPKSTTTVCYVCNIKFDTQEELLAHKNEPSHPKGYQTVVPCPICAQPFMAKRMKYHLMKHSPDKPCVCSICGKAFKNAANLKRHAFIHTVDGEKPFKCDICGKGFAQAQSRKEHMHLHASEDRPSYECKECGKVFTLWRYYRLHVTSKCMPEKEAEEEPGDEKLEHRAIELGIDGNQFLCQYCGKRFFMKRSYIVHVRSHEGIKPYLCTVCGKRFTQGAALNIHKLTHTGEKPHACKICNKKFTQSSHLNYHMKQIHSTERPFVCIHCGKGFALKGNLTAHVRTHTGETPYICNYCGRGFHNSNNMNKHRRSQHGHKHSARPSVITKTSSEDEFVLQD